MAIKDGYFECDFCSGIIGEFSTETGNHLACENSEFMKQALEICVMFLTNVNTITTEKQAEVVKYLRLAGMTDEADAVALGGFASVFDPGFS
jgi:hypothetical protein